MKRFEEPALAGDTVVYKDLLGNEQRAEVVCANTLRIHGVVKNEQGQPVGTVLISPNQFVRLEKGVVNG